MSFTALTCDFFISNSSAFGKAHDATSTSARLSGGRRAPQSPGQERSDFGDGRFNLVAVPTIVHRVLLPVQAPKQVLGGQARCLETLVHSFWVAPLPVPDLRHVLAVAGDILLVLDTRFKCA